MHFLYFFSGIIHCETGVIADDKMEVLINSVKESGVITPVLFRPSGENHYEMLSIPRFRSHSIRYKEPPVPNGRAT